MKNRRVHVETAKLVAQRGEPIARRLYAAFADFNALYFRGKLDSPLILITNAGSTRTLGDYIAKDIHGLESRIRIAPKVARMGMKFMLDVLLHECIHAYQWEVLGNIEPGYAGHGPIFAGECNRIGQKMGLDPVGVKGRDGLPRCDYWPMVVRPKDYYGFEYGPPTRRKKAEPVDGDEGEDENGDISPPKSVQQLDALTRALKKLETPLLKLFRGIVEEELKGRTPAKKQEPVKPGLAKRGIKIKRRKVAAE